MNGFALTLAVVLGLLVGFGGSFYFFADLLDKSNNIGDSLCGFDAYCKRDIHYTRNRDGVSQKDKDAFLRDFGGDPEVQRSYTSNYVDEDPNAIPDDLPPVDKPIFKSQG